jgi:hypothetical protein
VCLCVYTCAGICLTVETQSQAAIEKRGWLQIPHFAVPVLTVSSHRNRCRTSGDLPPSKTVLLFCDGKKFADV